MGSCLRAYFGEFGKHWPNLVTAGVGLAMGSALNHYTLSLFGPAMIRDLGWDRADFALIGLIPLLLVFTVPLAGRFTDRFGTRIAATVGFVAMSLGFLAMAAMNGGIEQFFAIYLVQHTFGILTTSMVFCRVVVERFDTARGFALSLLLTAPPLAGAWAAPLLGWVISDYGWRAGYVVVAGFCALGGLIAISRMPNSRRTSDAPRPPSRKLSRAELFELLRNPVLLLVVAGMFLVNIPQVFASSQLKLVVMESGVSDQLATWMVSLYALGVIIGRFLSGLALDRVEPHYVAMAALGLPAAGYLIFASHITETALLVMAVMLVGLAQGAEADIGAYFVSRRFDIRNFSLLQSLLTMMTVLGSAAGSLVMSVTLSSDGTYEPFLLVSAVGTLLGAILFALTGSFRRPLQALAATSSPRA